MNLSSSDRFALISLALCRAVAACLGRGLMEAPMILLVWTRVRRAEVAFLALVERVRSGRFRGGWTRVSGVAGVRAAVAARTDQGVRPPLRFGWLLRLVPFEVGGYAGQLRTVLAEPDMEALVRDVAQARRILGPVCRMLGVELPGRPAPAAPAPALVGGVVAAGRTRVARTRVVGEPWRVPLPRGVLAAARRQGFGKIVR